MPRWKLTIGLVAIVVIIVVILADALSKIQDLRSLHQLVNQLLHPSPFGWFLLAFLLFVTAVLTQEFWSKFIPKALRPFTSHATPPSNRSQETEPKPRRYRRELIEELRTITKELRAICWDPSSPKADDVL